MNSLPSYLQHISPQEAATELLKRRKARRSLLDFTLYTNRAYIAEPAHALIASRLDAIVEGQLQRLIVIAPPQHGKSELCSVRLPAYWQGRRPDDPVILSSYGAALAESKSRQARDTVESVEFATLFPGITTRKDSRSVSEWSLADHRGGLLAAGVGGPVTGHGGLLGVVDDPFENWEQAQSQTIRDKVWDWYRATFRTRIWEGGAIVVIMTRWHEDDLIGRLLSDQKEEWEILRLPAVAETQEERDESHKLVGLPAGLPDPLGRQSGEPLCPRRYSGIELKKLRRDVGSLAWFAEYQGTPRAPEGNRFKRAWFEIVNAAPKSAWRVRYWDKAGTQDDGAYTCGLLMARDAEDVFYVEDVIRGQWSDLERERTIKQTAQLDRTKYGAGMTTWMEQEGGSGGKESAQATIRRLAGHSVHAERVTGSKEVRAEPFAAQAEAMNVKLVRASWNGAYLDELASFPSGKFKDQVDGSSGAFNKLTAMDDEPVIVTLSDSDRVSISAY